MSPNRSGHDKVRKELRNRRISIKRFVKLSRDKKCNGAEREIITSANKAVALFERWPDVPDAEDGNDENSMEEHPLEDSTKKKKKGKKHNHDKAMCQGIATDYKGMNDEDLHEQVTNGHDENSMEEPPLEDSTKKKKKGKKHNHSKAIRQGIASDYAGRNDDIQVTNGHDENSMEEPPLEDSTKKKKKGKMHNHDKAMCQGTTTDYKGMNDEDLHEQVGSDLSIEAVSRQIELLRRDPDESVQNLTPNEMDADSEGDEENRPSNCIKASPLDLKDLKRKIRMLEINEISRNKKMDGMATDLQEIKGILMYQFRPVAGVEDQQNSLLPKVPLKKLKHVLSMEVNVNENREYKKQLLYKTSVIGGKNIKQNVIRIFKRLFSSKLKTKMCWNGSVRGKTEFKNFTGILDVLRQAVGCTEDQLEHECKLRFNQAQKDYDREEAKKRLAQINLN